ncbi:unnamed protein product [Trichobilharzia szidati]|nr:unnamed protein product [Trichobilharzia szidati]
MLHSQVLLISLLLILTQATLSINGDCVPLNQRCTKTIFSPCCNNTVCKLDGPFYGRCVECLADAAWCWHDNECCSGNCDWFRCIKREN